METRETCKWENKIHRFITIENSKNMCWVQRHLFVYNNIISLNGSNPFGPPSTAHFTWMVATPFSSAPYLPWNRHLSFVQLVTELIFLPLPAFPPSFTPRSELFGKDCTMLGGPVAVVLNQMQRALQKMIKVWKGHLESNSTDKQHPTRRRIRNESPTSGEGREE